MRRAGRSLFASILCPVDFSAHSALALRYAASIARRGGGTLHVLFVNDPLLVAAAAAAYNRAALGAASHVELQRFVRETLPPRALSRARLHVETALGAPAREILRAIQQNRHDLVVLGTKGLNAARRLFLGSTTMELLRRARIPVLAVPPADADATARVAVDAAWPGRTLVGAIEFGPHAAADVLRAADVARWFRTQLMLAHVVPIPSMPPWLSADVDEHLRQNCAKADEALSALRGEIRGVRSTAIVRVGHAPDQIAAIAADYRAGLIVMGLRGRAGLFGEPAGTCAYEVLRHGVAPVLALPDRRRTTSRG